MCGLHRARGDEELDFLVQPQNQGRRFVSGLASKSLGRFSPVCPQNQWQRFTPFLPQNRWLGFSYLVLKTGSSGLVICASKSLQRCFGFGLKTKQDLVY
jgi:hypothetical protein